MSFISFLRDNKHISEDIYSIALFEIASSYSFDVYEFIHTSCNMSEDEILRLKSQYYKMKTIDFEKIEKIDSFDYTLIKDCLSIPCYISEDCVEIATYDPEDFSSFETVRRALFVCEKTRNLKTEISLAKKSDIISALQNMINHLKTDNITDYIINDAISMLASDIHITPFEHILEIKYRIDGDLILRRSLRKDEFQSICVSMKVLSKLDISESRRPQSGHFHKSGIDFRVSTHPTIYGENIVIRILNKNKDFISIENIGFSKSITEYLKTISNFSNGMIIFCGPTGSGKTTSIYSILSTLDKNSKNIVTLEDPVEYKIPGVRQTEIRKGVIDFADGVRSVLRQDPDVIFIGEIRDYETAKMAVRASMTGHLVFTTIHANDSFGALKRFQDFDIPSSVVADNIIAVVSQRLIKKTNGGRVVISETLRIDEHINEMIYDGTSKSEILAYASKALEFKSMYEDCKEKIKNRITTEEEVKNILHHL